MSLLNKRNLLIRVCFLLFIFRFFSFCSSKTLLENSVLSCDSEDLSIYEQSLSTCISPKIIVVSNTLELESALNSLIDCSEIRLTPGIYIISSSLSINKNYIKLIGSKEAPTNIQLEKNSSLLARGIGLHFESLYFSYLSQPAISIIDSYAVSLYNVSIVRNPQLVHSATYGISIEKTKYFSISESTISGGIHAGLSIQQVAHINISNNIFQKNTVGISLTRICNATIANNTFQNNTAGLLIYQDSGEIFRESSLILNNQNILIKNNIIENNNLLTFCQNNKKFFSENVISDIFIFQNITPECHIPSGTGLAILGARNIEIKNNNFRMQLNSDIFFAHAVALTLDLRNAVPNKNIFIHNNQFTQNISRWEELVFSQSYVESNFGSYSELVHWFGQFSSEDSSRPYFVYLKELAQKADNILDVEHATSLDILILNLARIYNSRFVVKYLFDGVLDIIDDRMIQFDFNMSLLPIPNIITDGFDGNFLLSRNKNIYKICIATNNTGGKGGIDSNVFNFPIFLDLNLIQSVSSLITGHTLFSGLPDNDPARLFIQYIYNTEEFANFTLEEASLEANIDNLLLPSIERDKILYLHGGKYIRELRNKIDTSFNVNSYGPYSIEAIECQGGDIEVVNLDLSSVLLQ